MLDLGLNAGKIKVGDLITFRTNYMGTLSLMNSNYIDKVVQSEATAP